MKLGSVQYSMPDAKLSMSRKEIETTCFQGGGGVSAKTAMTKQVPSLCPVCCHGLYSLFNSS